MKALLRMFFAASVATGVTSQAGQAAEVSCTDSSGAKASLSFDGPNMNNGFGELTALVPFHPFNGNGEQPNGRKYISLVKPDAKPKEQTFVFHIGDATALEVDVIGPPPANTVLRRISCPIPTLP